MGDVAFHSATTVDEALALVGDGSDAKVVAGGSDLIVQARGGRALHVPALTCRPYIPVSIGSDAAIPAGVSRIVARVSSRNAM